MKKYTREIISILAILLFLFQYSRAASLQKETDQKIVQDLIEQRRELEKINKSQEEEIKELQKSFTYLDGLTTEERARYKYFRETKNSDDLALSAEKTLLVYLHAASNADVEILYALTDHSQSLEGFSDHYYTDGRMEEDAEDVIVYRYYDEVRTLEGDETGDTGALVEITVSQSATERTRVYRLKKLGIAGSWVLQPMSKKQRAYKAKTRGLLERQSSCLFH